MGRPSSFSNQYNQGTLIMRTSHVPMNDTFTKISHDDDMVVPHDHDVLSGRGVNIAHHPGNERFRTLVTSRADYSYCTTYSASEKRAVAEEIIRHIQSLSPPGRFLKKKFCKSEEEEDFKWEILTPRDTLKKTCQALRDCNRTDREGYAIGVVPPVDVVQSAAHRAHSGLTGKQHAAAAVAAKNAAAAAAAVTTVPCSKSNRKRNFPAINSTDVKSTAEAPIINSSSIPSKSINEVSVSSVCNANTANSTTHPYPPQLTVKTLRLPQPPVLFPNSATSNSNVSSTGSTNTISIAKLDSLQQQPLAPNQTIPTPKTVLQINGIPNVSTGVCGGPTNVNALAPSTNNKPLMLQPNNLRPLPQNSLIPSHVPLKPVTTNSVIPNFTSPLNTITVNSTKQILPPAPSANSQNLIATTMGTTVANVNTAKAPVALAPFPVNKTVPASQIQTLNVPGSKAQNLSPSTFPQNNTIPTIIPPITSISKNTNLSLIPTQYPAVGTTATTMAPQFPNKNSQEMASQSFSTTYSGNGNAPLVTPKINSLNNGPSPSPQRVVWPNMTANVNNLTIQSSMPPAPALPSNNSNPMTTLSPMINSSVKIINNAPVTSQPAAMAPIPSINSGNVSATPQLIRTMSPGAPSNINTQFKQQNQQGLTIVPAGLPNVRNAPYAQPSQPQIVGAPVGTVNNGNALQPPIPMKQQIHSGINTISTITQAAAPIAPPMPSGSANTSPLVRPVMPIAQPINLGMNSNITLPQPATALPQTIVAGNNRTATMTQPAMPMGPPIPVGNMSTSTIQQPSVPMAPPIPANNGPMANPVIHMAPPVPAKNVTSSAPPVPLSNRDISIVQPVVPMVTPIAPGNNNAPGMAQPIQIPTQILPNSSSTARMQQVMKMATHIIPSGNHLNSTMPQILQMAPIVAANTYAAKTMRPSTPMAQPIASDKTSSAPMPPPGSVDPSPVTGNSETSTISKAPIPLPPSGETIHSNAVPMAQPPIPMAPVAQPNNVALTTHLTLNVQNMHQSNPETNSTSQMTMTMASTVSQTNHETTTQPNLTTEINNASRLVFPPSTQLNHSNTTQAPNTAAPPVMHVSPTNQLHTKSSIGFSSSTTVNNNNNNNNNNNSLPLTSLNGIPGPTPITTGPPSTTSISQKQTLTMNSSRESNPVDVDVGRQEWNNCSRNKKLKLVDELLSDPLPPSYPTAQEIAGVPGPSNSQPEDP